MALNKLLSLVFALALVCPFASAQGPNASAAPQPDGAVAQQPTGSLRGVVKDPAGGVVVGATVTLVDASGTEKTATTNQEGVYTFTGVAPGHYTVRAVQGGFAPFENTDVNVTGRGAERLDITLAVALTQESVTVQSEPAVSTDPENNQSALVIKDKDLDALPDDPDDLAAALQALAGPAAGPNGGQIYVDGFSNGQIPPKDAIREIRINQNPFSAEFDQIGFGRIEILTRPGSDKWRGQTFFSFSDESLNSRDPFANRRAPSQGRNFGGNLSGPIQKKKSSFFLNFEKRDTDSNVFINTQIIDPATLAAEPYVNTALVPMRRTSFSPRFDYAINKNNTLVLRYNYSHNAVRNNGASEQVLDVDPFFGLTRTSFSGRTEQSVQATETAILTPTVINETRFQFERETADSGGDISRPVLQVSGAFTAGGASSAPANNTNTNFELQNYTTWVRGLHSLKFGARLRDVHINDFTQGNFNGSYFFAGSFGGLTSSQLFQQVWGITRARALTTADPLPTQLNITFGDPLATVSRFDVGAFLQDDWRVRPNFTLSAGLRYENQSNISSNFNFAPRLSFAYSLGGAQSRPKTVIRGGFGVFYNRFSESLTLAANRFNGTNQQQFLVTQQPLPPACGSGATTGCATPDQIAAIQAQNALARTFLSLFPNVPTSAAALAPFATARITRRVASDLQAPYSIQSTASVEHQLPYNMTGTITFINTRSLHLLRTRNINAPVNGVRPFGDAAGNVYLYESSGILNQNQLRFQLSTRLNPKFSVFGYYQLNFAKSDTDGAGTFPVNQYDFTGEYGPASSDIRHTFTLVGTWDAPWWGLRFNPFVTAFSGRPFNIITGFDNNGDGIINDRPSLVSNSTCPGRTPVSTDVFCTPFGTFNVRPGAGDPVISRNFGRAPGYFAVNMRVSKTIGFGESRSARARAANGGQAGATTGGQNTAQNGGDRRGGGGGGRGGDRGAGGLGGMMGGGGPRGGGGFGGFGGPGGASDKRYQVTFSVNVNNLLNNVNLAAPVGNLSSPLFGQSRSSSAGFGGFGGGGPFGGGGAAGNRRVELQVRFNF